MLKNILFLLGCIAAVLVAWGVFQLLGKYTFLLMLVITIVALIMRIDKPKFSKK